MKTSEILGRVIAQVTSGRWIITVAATVCLIKLAWTLCNLMIEGKVTLETATYVAIIMSILNTIGTITVFYFNKPRSEESAGDFTVTNTTTTLLPK